MHTLNKTLAILLTISLLGQNALFALPVRLNPQDPPFQYAPNTPHYGFISSFDTTDYETHPLTVKQYRDRARQDAAQAADRSNLAYAAAALAGAGLTFAVMQIKHQAAARQMSQQMEEALRSESAAANNLQKELIRNQKLTKANQKLMGQLGEQAQELTGARLQLEAAERELAGVEAEISAMQQHQQKLRVQNAGLKKARETNLYKLRVASAEKQAVIAEKNAALARVAELEIGLEKASQTIGVWQKLLGENVNAERYAALFGKTEAEIRAVLPQMLKEDLVFTQYMSLKEAQQLENPIIKALTHTTDSKTAAQMLRPSFVGHNAAASFLRSLSKALKSKSTLIMLGLFALSATAYASDRTQQRAMRILDNPELLLELSDEEADAMQQDEMARTVCRLASDAIHAAKDFDGQTVKEFKNSSIRAKFQTPANLAY